MLLFAFAFAVMADPVSSIAYAIEAALRALHGHLGLLVLTMSIVLAIIYVVKVNYDQLISRFPEGGGAVAAAGAAFGEGWAFFPLGALIVDFVLTISISVAAAASAVIAYFPRLAGGRVAIALGLLVFVAGLTWFGHLGRRVFATMTVAFLAAAVPVILLGFVSPASHGAAVVEGARGDVGLLTVLLAFPVAMALATGVEAPASAIAQLGQLDQRRKERFGHVTLWLTVLITAALTLSIAVLAVRLRVGIPRAGSTMIADVARNASGDGVWFALFQLTSSLLLLAAASSSFQAGPGLLKALARHTRRGGEQVGILPASLGRTNVHHTPYWSVVVYLGVSAAVVLGAGGRDQELVLFYAVAVFVSFLAGLLAMIRFSLQESNRWHLAVNAVGAIAVTFTIGINLRRGYPIASLAVSLAIAFFFFRLWDRLGRPRGIAMAEQEAEQELGQEES
ncbi:MAG: APC family permease [Actinobacteria bacterium]|nr:APC family permease [Actinomycetota bacterium]